ncbi:hypothetical protein DM01DRAFT_1330933 [Hesseltinella vesiculosa]|uniref:Uncharacterized protein n=1 Tax=Hesseltinella vesiculosa TaxID=101127 RepID=A0A1X2GXR3_9FUNG|nr:hypothetical protein DM01DRAFT_1330933 [Hesseltinella vesiculosa]
MQGNYTTQLLKLYVGFALLLWLMNITGIREYIPRWFSLTCGWENFMFYCEVGVFGFTISNRPF